MTEQQKTDTPSEDEELLFEFFVGTRYTGSEASDTIDLIAEGWVDSLAEWESYPLYKKEGILGEILEGFVANNIESWWSQVDG